MYTVGTYYVLLPSMEEAVNMGRVCVCMTYLLTQSGVLYPSSFKKEFGVRYITFPLAASSKCPWMIKQGFNKGLSNGFGF